MAPINLKIASSVNPTILNGSNNNQTIGNRNSMSSASGQQRTNKIHHKIRDIKIRIGGTTMPAWLSKNLPD
jgi:hypothetical protein